MKTCNVEIIDIRVGRRIDPVPLQFKHIPGTANLRSSAFICGLFFADKLETKISLQKSTRMTWIKRIFTDNLICANPRHPRNPRSIVASLHAKAPPISGGIDVHPQSLYCISTVNTFRGAWHYLKYTAYNEEDFD